MHNTFRRRLLFILFATITIWAFLWYSHSVVEKLNISGRRNCETIARLWAGVQYPLSLMGNPRGILSCSECGNPAGIAPEGTTDSLLFCGFCQDTTRFVVTSRLLPGERQEVLNSTRRLFADVTSRLDFPTVFSDDVGYPQIVDGEPTDGFPGRRLAEIRRRMQRMAEENDPVPLTVMEDTIGYLYYGNSQLNSDMEIIPFLELGFLLVIAAVIFFLLRSEVSREKHMSWAGFARETAHQLSTPLSSLMGWLELLRDDEAIIGNPDTAEAVSHMDTDVNRLARIAERYGQMGREAKLSPASAEDIIRETVEYFRIRKGLLGHGVVISVEGHCGGRRIMANSVLLGWVLENLIKNAVAACAPREDGGRITIACSPEESGGSIEITVSDNGNGIPYPDQGKVFRAGFTTRKGGWGLGLSLARRIVEEHHRGSLKLVRSVPGGGTVFSITIPVMKGGEGDNHSLGG